MCSTRRLTLWPSVLMHSVEDALVSPLTLEEHLRITPGRDRLVSSVLGDVSTVGYVGVGLALRAARRRGPALIRKRLVASRPTLQGRSVSDDDLVLQFIPSLVSLLLHHEREKGNPLTEQEVLDIRDSATVVAVPAHLNEAAAAQRGYDDLDPEDVWAEWQHARTELG